MNKPCEYCGVDLPLGVDLGTRRVRSRHFINCEAKAVMTHQPPPARSEFVDALRHLLQQARLSDLPDDNHAILTAENLLQREDA